MSEDEFDTILSQLNANRLYFPWKGYWYLATLIAVVTVLVMDFIIYKIVEHGGGSHAITLSILTLLLFAAIGLPLLGYYFFSKKLRKMV